MKTTRWTEKNSKYVDSINLETVDIIYIDMQKVLEEKDFSLKSIQGFSNGIVSVLTKAAVDKGNVKIHKTGHNRKKGCNQVNHGIILIVKLCERNVMPLKTFKSLLYI